MHQPLVPMHLAIFRSSPSCEAMTSAQRCMHAILCRGQRLSWSVNDSYKLKRDRHVSSVATVAPAVSSETSRHCSAEASSSFPSDPDLLAFLAPVHAANASFAHVSHLCHRESLQLTFRRSLFSLQVRGGDRQIGLLPETTMRACPLLLYVVARVAHICAY